jgi:tripartite-type tricarboxylate transporter receptor subunit TctC
MNAHARRVRCIPSVLVAAVGLVAVGFLARADPARDRYPSREVRAIVPFPPGGAIDAAVRIIEPPLSAYLGVPLVVMNRAGAGGMIGMAAVASAPPDGYTVAASSSTTLTLVGMTNHNVRYKTEHFIPLGNYVIDAGAIVVHGDSPWKTLEDLIAHAGQNPGKLSYGSPGSGSVSSFVIEAIKVQYDVKMVEVPFQGSPPANMAVLGKQVDFATVAFSNAAPMLNAGKLRALATSSEIRLPGYPDIPTLAEKGVRNASLGLTLGLYAAAKTPAHAVDVLATSLGVAMQNQTVTQSLEKAGLFVQYADRHGAQRQLDVEYRDVLELGRRLNRMQQQ